LEDFPKSTTEDDKMSKYRNFTVFFHSPNISKKYQQTMNYEDENTLKATFEKVMEQVQKENE